MRSDETEFSGPGVALAWAFGPLAAAVLFAFLGASFWHSAYNKTAARLEREQVSNQLYVEDWGTDEFGAPVTLDRAVRMRIGSPTRYYVAGGIVGLVVGIVLASVYTIRKANEVPIPRREMLRSRPEPRAAPSRADRRSDSAPRRSSSAPSSRRR